MDVSQQYRTRMVSFIPTKTLINLQALGNAIQGLLKLEKTKNLVVSISNIVLGHSQHTTPTPSFKQNGWTHVHLPHIMAPKWQILGTHVSSSHTLESISASILKVLPYFLGGASISSFYQPQNCPPGLVGGPFPLYCWVSGDTIKSPTNFI